MAKSNNPTPVSRKTPKKRTLPLKESKWLEDYLDCFSLKMKPVTEAFITRLAHELNEWSKRDDSLILKTFYSQKEIPRESFYRWARTYPEFGAMLVHARERIAARRELGGMTRKYDPSFIANSMPMYDEDWKELVQWKSSLKDPESSNKNVTLVLPDITSKCGCGDKK